MLKLWYFTRILHVFFLEGLKHFERSFGFVTGSSLVNLSFRDFFQSLSAFCINLFSDCITCSGSTILKTGGSSRKRKLLKRTKSTHHLSPSGILQLSPLGILQLSPSGISPITFRYITSYLYVKYLSPSGTLPLTFSYITPHLQVYHLSPSGILPLTYRYITSHLQLYYLSPPGISPITFWYIAYHLQVYYPSTSGAVPLIFRYLASLHITKYL